MCIRNKRVPPQVRFFGAKPIFVCWAFWYMRMQKANAHTDIIICTHIFMNVYIWTSHHCIFAPNLQHEEYNFECFFAAVRLNGVLAKGCVSLDCPQISVPVRLKNKSAIRRPYSEHNESHSGGQIRPWFLRAWNSWLNSCSLDGLGPWYCSSNSLHKCAVRIKLCDSSHYAKLCCTTTQHILRNEHT